MLKFRIFAFQTNECPELYYLPIQSNDLELKTYIFGAEVRFKEWMGI
jgi:hypothetical protein